MRYKILAPNRNYTGVSAGVAFANGVGYTDDDQVLDWFERHGYEVEVAEEPVQVKQNPVLVAIPDLSFDDVSADKLRHAAAIAGLDHEGKDKAELVEMLTEHFGEPEGNDEEQTD